MTNRRLSIFDIPIQAKRSGEQIFAMVKLFRSKYSRELKHTVKDIQLRTINNLKMYNRSRLVQVEYLQELAQKVILNIKEQLVYTLLSKGFNKMPLAD